MTFPDSASGPRGRACPGLVRAAGQVSRFHSRIAKGDLQFSPTRASARNDPVNPARFAICLLLAAAVAAAPPRVGAARVQPVRASLIDIGQVIDANAIRMFVTNTGSFAFD